MKTGLKSIFVFAALLLPSLCVYAQKPIEIKEERKGYTGNVEAIVGIMELGLNTTQGYRFNNHWSIGANTGINISWAGPVVPLCAVGQFDIPVGKSTSVLFNAKVGGVFALTDDYDLKHRAGLNCALGVGLRYKRMSYQLAYNVAMIKYYQHDTDEILDGYGTIQLRIGFNFGAR